MKISNDFKESPRILALESMFDCPVRRGLIKRLGDEGLKIVTTFIREYDDLSYGEFSAKVNRLYLDSPARPKNSEVIVNILTEVNGALFERRKRDTK